MSGKYYPWGYRFTSEIEHISLLLVTAWLLSLILVKIYFNKKKNVARCSLEISTAKTSYSALIVFALLLIDAALMQRFAGFNNLFTRLSFAFNSGSVFDIAIDYLLKAYPILAVYILKTNRKQTAFNKIVLWLAFIYACLVNNPLTNSRFLALTAYFGLFVSLFPKILSWKYIDFLIIFGVCVLFPLASQFKGSSNIDISKYKFSSIFLSADFDAFCFIESAVLYHFKFGNCYGSQIVSSIFFFVPRAIIPIKGIASGELLVNSLFPGNFNNVSCPFVAEGLLDFGFVGAFVYLFIFASITNLIDFKNVGSCKCKTLLSFIYPFLMGYWIFIMRGALAPTILRLFGFLLPFFIFSAIFRKETRLARRKNRKMAYTLVCFRSKN